MNISPSQKVLSDSTVLEGVPQQNKEGERHWGPENTKSTYIKAARGIPRVRVKADPQGQPPEAESLQRRLKQGKGLQGTALQGESMERLPNILHIQRLHSWGRLVTVREKTKETNIRR